MATICGLPGILGTRRGAVRAATATETLGPGNGRGQRLWTKVAVLP